MWKFEQGISNFLVSVLIATRWVVLPGDLEAWLRRSGEMQRSEGNTLHTAACLPLLALPSLGWSQSHAESGFIPALPRSLERREGSSRAVFACLLLQLHGSQESSPLDHINNSKGGKTHNFSCLYKGIRKVFLAAPKRSCVQQISLKAAGADSKGRLLDRIRVVFSF